jgi:hypothetical protein
MLIDARQDEITSFDIRRRYRRSEVATQDFNLCSEAKRLSVSRGYVNFPCPIYVLGGRAEDTTHIGRLDPISIYDRNAADAKVCKLRKRDGSSTAETHDHDMKIPQNDLPSLPERQSLPIEPQIVGLTDGCCRKHPQYLSDYAKPDVPFHTAIGPDAACWHAAIPSDYDGAVRTRHLGEERRHKP